MPNPDRLAPPRPVEEPVSYSPEALPSPATRAGPARSIEDLGSYYLVIFDSRSLPGPSAGVVKKNYQVIGDHLTILECAGRSPVYLRFGSPTNPLLRVQEGMVLARQFRSVTFVVDGGFVGPLAFASRVVAYASVGPLLVVPPIRKYGLSYADMFRGEATTTWRPLARIGLPFNTFRRTPGKRGGSVIIYNEEYATPLYLRYGNRDSGGAVDVSLEGFPVPPRHALSFPLDATMEGAVYALQIGVTSGTGKYRCCLSTTDSDVFDAEQLAPEGLQ